MTEEEAFLYEKELSELYKKKNQCFCNLAPCGKGGCHFPWTQEMKEYWSKNNPMKEEKQRERMKNNNPIHNKKIAEKNGLAHKRAVSINGIIYESRIEASEVYGVSKTTISNWCIKGINPKGEKCFFPDAQIRTSKKGTPVIVDGKYYSSIAIGAQHNNINPSTLASALKKGQCKCKGHTCEYANQQPSRENSNNSISEGSTTNG